MLVALCAALAVLVHHDSTAVTGPRAMAPMPMAGMVTAAMADHEGHPVTSSPDAIRFRPDARPAATATPALHADNALSCSDGVQHCGAAGVETVELSPPREAFSASAAMRLLPSRDPATTRSAERAPPELSVLSQLRI
ncbi:hypothetical protein [Streptomyces hilarionis]|uniref:hypothetical protein n=1 Tax=Streptomyces hilarionis TaxID=2839954 RepID=UPI00211A5661|nr:hypothetical protein [Streptomyces hilarionis]MCQ9133017.1 hypothetical protein [Streptomyces hilarionis]